MHATSPLKSLKNAKFSRYLTKMTPQTQATSVHRTNGDHQEIIGYSHRLNLGYSISVIVD